MGKKDHGDATSTIQTRKDPTDGFTRTAIVVEERDAASIDLVAKDGRLLARVNVSYFPNSDGEEGIIVDTIDVDKRYTEGRALAFAQGKRAMVDVPKGGNLVSADFRRKV